MSTVKSLSQMMSSALGAGGDCETCGPGVTPTKVTRTAMSNLAKLNKPVSKVAAQPTPQATPAQMKAVEEPEKKRGRPFAPKAVEIETEGAND